ncbi:MAG TPA: SWIM zinc finger family protein [Stenomitos sp.]
MSIVWTTEQVLALSPDANSTKSGQQLATANKWNNLGSNAAALWGECQGSGKSPYRTQIDLSEPAFRCSCPSRKFPCKHGLGLFLLFAAQPDRLTAADPPDWVQEWLEKRSQTTQKKQTAASDKPVDAAAQAKRIAQRETKVLGGLADLDRWLRDSVSQGLAALQTQPYRYWDATAARLMDAQAPALAKRVRGLASIPQSGEGWPQRLLAELGSLHLLVQGYQRLSTLPAAVQAELRSQIGWTVKQDELFSLANQSDPTVERCSDQWWVLGRRVLEEDDLQLCRVWLRGETTGRDALLLSFAHRSQALDCPAWPGTRWSGELVFYPGLFPLRAAILSRDVSSTTWSQVPAGMQNTCDEAIAHYRAAKAQNPWLPLLPMLLDGVVPLHREDQWELVDADGFTLPLEISARRGWSLLAVSGGRPIQVFGEWDGSRLVPLSVGAEGSWILMESLL